MTDLAHPQHPTFAFDAFDPGWRCAPQSPCVLCDRPAHLLDPDGQPRHRVDCTALDVENAE